MIKIKFSLSFILFFIGSIAIAQNLKLVKSDNGRLNYMGRVQETDSCTKFYWCGTSVQLKVENSPTVKVILSENFDVNYYDIIIDGKYNNKIKILKGKHTYDVANGLSNETHIIQLFKATNTDEHITSFYGFLVSEDAEVLRQKDKKELKMEFFGDSITAGHGVEVPDGQPDSWFPEFFNNYFTYAAITSRYFNAAYHNTSKSGIGITVSWDKAIMPEIYNRLNPNDSLSTWDFKKYQPDIVVVNLFQNDNSLVINPKHVQFKRRFGTTKPSEDFIINAYANFVSSLRKVYPKAKIICALGNMDAVNKGSKWPSYIQKAILKLNDKKIYCKIFEPKTTSGHPRIKEQNAMANELIKFIENNKLDKS
jgi:hypothetical protein